MDRRVPKSAVAAGRGPGRFYDEQVDTFIDGFEQPRPETHFFKP
jgi:hypothetical protein